MTDRRIYLIDGSGFIFRAFFAYPAMERRDGTPINAVYGFCNILQKLLWDVKTADIAVIFDAGRRNFRHDIYPAYKAQRPALPEGLAPQLPIMRDATRAFGIPAIELEGYEADDLIATYARIATEQNMETCIVSSDKDLMQLMTNTVSIYDPMKGTELNVNDVIAKFGVAPHRVADVQALAGDAVDNVPGVPGIGVKTAAALIKEYGNLENILSNIDSIPYGRGRYAQLLTKYKDQARISKQLVLLNRYVPVPLQLASITRTPNHAQLLAFLSAQGFNSIMQRMKTYGVQ